MQGIRCFKNVLERWSKIIRWTQKLLLFSFFYFHIKLKNWCDNLKRVRNHCFYMYIWNNNIVYIIFHIILIKNKYLKGKKSCRALNDILKSVPERWPLTFRWTQKPLFFSFLVLHINLENCSDKLKRALKHIHLTRIYEITTFFI